MKDYTNNAPAFSEIIQITETSDPAHADIINKAPIQIFQNTLHNRKTIEKLKSSAGNAEVYNTETEYQKGNYCTYNDAMYKCIQPTQGEWDPTCWEEINLLSEISDLQIPEFDDSGTAAGITSFPTFLQKVKSKMNIFEFYRNFKAGMQYVLHAGQIVNNCASDAADLPLAAAQGKALWDQITRLNSEIEVISEDDSDAIMWVKEKYRTMPDRSIRILYNMHAAEALYIFCRNSSTWGVVYKNLRAANNPVFQKLRMSSGTWDTDWYYAIRFVNNPNDWDALATGQPEGITISDVGIGEANAPKTKGFPVGAYSYGCLVTIVSLRSPDPRDLFRNIQIYIPHHSPGYAVSKLIYIRTLRDSDGKTWRAFSPGEIVNAQTV